jgi:amidohydrolase
VLALQTIVSRQVDVTLAPAVVTVGRFDGGVRNNIIPDSAWMEGTIRTFDLAMRESIHERIRRTAESIAESAGATAVVDIRKGTPVTYNDPELTRSMMPSLERIVGERVLEAPRVTGAEDFAYFQERVPGMYFFLGVRPPDVPREEAVPNHSPYFSADESALVDGVRLMSSVAVDYLANHGGRE